MWIVFGHEYSLDILMSILICKKCISNCLIINRNIVKHIVSRSYCCHLWNMGRNFWLSWLLVFWPGRPWNASLFFSVAEKNHASMARLTMELSDWVNKITFSEILFLPAIFDWNNPKKHVYCSFPTGFSGNLFAVTTDYKIRQCQPKSKIHTKWYKTSELGYKLIFHFFSWTIRIMTFIRK